MGDLAIGSICSGVGGLDLGLERAGLGRTIWQVEIDPFARRVLARHWPEAQRFEDLRALTEAPAIDLLCGGFPCQPHSQAGKRKASNDERDLWPDVRRLAGLLLPTFLVLENVPALLTSEQGAFFGGILRDLDALGYAVEWDHLPALAVGAPHIRDRVFLMARRDGGLTWEEGDEAPVGLVSGLFGATAQRWPRAGRWTGGRGWARVARWPVPGEDSGLWPTPNAGDFNAGEDPAAFLARRAELAARHGNNGCGIPLGMAVRIEAERNAGRIWPTPRAAEHKGVGPLGSRSHDHRLAKGYLDATVQEAEGITGKLNPDWEEWLVGLPPGWTLPEGPSLLTAPSLPFHPEPAIPRLTTVREHRTDRVRCIGNIVVPQAGETIGCALREALAARGAA